ncbi:MAG: hypothetical protein ACREYE_27635, partial [Gammaproteobacteria bacterium]
FMQRLAALVPRPIQGSISLHTVPGFGPLISTALATVLQRTPFAKADAAVAFSGLDPRPRAPAVIAKILTHLGLPIRVLPRSPARPFDLLANGLTPNRYPIPSGSAP